MNYLHEEKEFESLLEKVGRTRGIDPAFVEKDYWITHCLWALHETGLAIWFKGGTSLSKAFRIVERFSEDLDLMVQPGTVSRLPVVSNWTSTNRGPIEERRRYYEALARELTLPDVRVELEVRRVDPKARSADYLAHYPGKLLGQLDRAVSPFVRLEVGRARVSPSVECAISSFIHDHIEEQGTEGFLDNRPRAVRCLHPLVTLIEKLDAIAKRYARKQFEPDGFVRHYEDAAAIIRAMGALPAVESTPRALAEEMLAERSIARLPWAKDPALLLADDDKRAAIEMAYAKIQPMFWGARVPLAEACDTIRAWIEQKF